MIAARLAGGNLFFGFLLWGLFGWGILWWGLWEHSEQLGALGFFEGIFLGDSFFWGAWGVFWIESVGKN